jgi:4-hydroxy-3-polyprenylbenzoate decarboxylase
MRITIAITGASGAIYARQLVERLVELRVSVELIFTENGRAVAEYENQIGLFNRNDIKYLDNKNMFASPASGSGCADAMVIVPCSMGMIGRIASGCSNDLISRAADVMLKEGLPLIVVPREVPFNTIHLRNLCELCNAGATICPAAPSFYNNPSNIEELCSSVTERIIRLLGLKSNQLPWGNR